MILASTAIACFSQKREINSRLISNLENEETNKNISIELVNGSILKGELQRIDTENEVVVIKNASDSTVVDFQKIYKIHDGNKSRGNDYLYRIEVPERFFHTPMGNTIPEGMVSLENNFFLNNAIKVGITSRWEGGLGFTMYPNNDEDSSMAILPMATLKYKYINKRHFKATVGVTSLQLPPIFSPQSGGLSDRKPWFHVVYTSANWEYKYGTFTFSAAQPYLNTYPLRYANSITSTDNGIDYMFSGSFSVKVFPFAHFISENIFLSGAWNTLGKPNRISRETYLIPLIGGRYYGDYYSFAGGVTNVLVPNAVFWFYLGGSYYFQ